MVYQERSTIPNQKRRNDYRWLTGCRSFGFTVLGFDGDVSEPEAESLVDSEFDDESDDVSEEDEEEDDDDDDDEEEDGVAQFERFLFLNTA